MNGEKKLKITIGIIFLIPIMFCLFLISKKNSSCVKEDTIRISLGTNKEFEEEKEDTNVIENKTYLSSELKIMGYQDFDYAKAMSFVLTMAKASSNGIEGMDFNGLTLKDHLINLNKAAYTEGVNPNIVLAQQVLETSIYAYKYETVDANGQTVIKHSVVKPSDYNFAGIGAVDSGNSCNSFPDNYVGQLAQVQHLKAYASTDSLNAELVDPRFKYVTRGKATTVEGLSKAWASNENYGIHITKLYNELISHEINDELINTYKDKIF